MGKDRNGGGKRKEGREGMKGRESREREDFTSRRLCTALGNFRPL